MTAATCDHRHHRSRPLRVRLRELRLLALGMLVIATAWPLLPHGFGLTCPLRATTGIPCPFCGLTRGVVATAQLDLPAAVQWNPAALPLVVAALALVVAWRVRSVRLPRAVVPVSLVALGGLWAYQIAMFPTGL